MIYTIYSKIENILRGIKRMDLSLKLQEYKLNIRTAGIIIHNDQILVHKNINEDYCCLPGGRIKLGESSKEALKREIKEELGKEV